MKKSYLFLTFFFLAISAIAQNTPPENAAAQNEVKQDWQTFAPDLEEFAVAAPAVLIPGFVNDYAAKTTTNRSYSLLKNGNYYFIFSDNLKFPDQNKTVFKFAGISADQIKQNVIFRFADNLGFYHRILTIQTLNRIYTFQTVSEMENDPQLDRFFVGIKINSIAPDLKYAASSNNQAPVSTSNNQSSNGNSGKGMGSGTGSEIGSGNGVGSGSGSGNGTGISATPAAPVKTTTPLKILSKPRPSYTDYARFYGITGTVRVRVTFLANGTIGSVAPVNKLPFGITQQAVAAAKALTFEPQTVEGKAVSVLKMVEYSFSIY